MKDMLRRSIESVSIDLSCNKDCDSCERFFDCPEQIKWEVLERTGKPSRIRTNLSRVRYKIAITAGKGGVGKTLTTVNIATALAMRGYKVAVLDQDFEGPNDHVMLGVKDKKLKVRKDGKIEPVEALLGIKVLSMGNVLGADKEIHWFYEMRRSATFEFLAYVNYGERDFLVIDLPPGTSADAVNVFKYLPGLNGVIGVTAPTEVTSDVVRRALLLAKKAGIPILGIIENMSGLICPGCGEYFEPLRSGAGERNAKILGVPFLGKIPLEPSISKSSNVGVPFVYSHPNSASAKAIQSVVDVILKSIKVTPFLEAPR